jgi:hypothetical protein
MLRVEAAIFVSARPVSREGNPVPFMMQASTTQPL